MVFPPGNGLVQLYPAAGWISGELAPVYLIGSIYRDVQEDVLGPCPFDRFLINDLDNRFRKR